MIYAVAALAAAVVLLVLLVWWLFTQIGREQRIHDRRVDVLLDRLAHAEGRTWTPPPVEEVPDAPPLEYSVLPEQDPDY